jgi:hypothetical protein
MFQRNVILFITLIFCGFFLQTNLSASEKLTTSERKAQFISKSETDISEYLPGVLIVKFKPDIIEIQTLEQSLVSGTSSIDNKIQQFGVNRIERVFKGNKSQESQLPDLSRIYKFNFSTPYDAKIVAKAFAKDATVEYAEPVYIQRIYTDPNDPLFNQQWYLRSVKAPQGWDIEQGDSTVIIAIIDSGVDTDHPDLFEKIWFNSDEIPNNNVDDDGNGFVDDFNGWDFEKSNADPNPDPDGVDNDGDGLGDGGVDHGTSMAGLAAAATNNGEGIAGLGWNCSIMPIKVMNDEGAGYTDNIAKGIQYAADNGAHVINLSLGSSIPSQIQRDAIEYAYGKHAIIVAAAGNQGSDNFHYLAAFEKVVAVGATGSEADRKSSISNFGIYVDVLAPGGDFNLSPPSEMISTVFYDPAYGFNHYYRARTKEGYLTAGTSSSAALVSGLMGLVKSQHSDWTNEQVIRQVVLTADNVDHLNLGFEGMLGSGLINAYRALAEMNPAEIAPKIKLIGNIIISDAVGGDNDNIFERGETIDVKTSTYRNYSVSPGVNVVFSITSDDTDLTINNGIFNFGYFPPDMELSVPLSFTFTVNNNAKGKSTNLYVGWQADGGYSGADTFKIIVGKIPILIVDDDSDEDDVEFPDADKFYTHILDNVKLNYALWDRYKLGALGPDQMMNFPIVIWLCAWAFPSLDPGDQLAVSNFLENGGSLFITGQDIGWDFNDPGGYGYQQRDFYAKYLHAIYYSDDSPVQEVLGIPGDPIGDGLEFSVWQPGLPVDYQFPDEIEPDTGATAVFEYSGGENHKFGIKYKGDHRVVYFGMGLEAIDSEENTPTDDNSPIRTKVLSRVLNWLNFIEHEPLSDTENLMEPRTVVAKVENNVAISDLIGVELCWRKESDSTFTTIPMSDIGNGQYRAEIPGLGEIANIEYYIKMVNSYYEWSNPVGAPQKFYSYYVGPDTVAPTFSHVPVKSIINGEVPRSVFVAVKDNIELDITAVYVHYTGKSISDSSRLISKDFPGQFGGFLPPVFSYGDTVFYYFSAYDNASSPNKGKSAVYSFLVGYEDFDSGLEYWSALPDGWGLDNTFAYSGEYSINDSPNQSPYPNNRNVSITTNFGIDLSNVEHAALKFYTRVYLELNHDFGYIEASHDGGLSWKQVADPINGFITTWKQKTISLSSFCGTGNSDVRIRFRMVSDATQAPPLPGWFIDDVQIIEGLNVTEVAEGMETTVPDRYTLYQNYPNPFNPTTTIRFDLPVARNVSLKIFNIKGELVRILINEKMNAGSYQIQWEGKDENGRSLSSGVYFYKLTVNKFNATRKLLLLK